MTIVAGFTDTEDARAALRHAVAEARLRDEPLAILQMRPDGGVPEDNSAALAEVMADAEVAYRVHEPSTRSRDIAGDLLRLAEEVSATLIVIGIRRRSTLGKLILGSQAQRILLDSSVPVLTVKPGRVSTK